MLSQNIIPRMRMRVLLYDFIPLRTELMYKLCFMHLNQYYVIDAIRIGNDEMY